MPEAAGTADRDSHVAGHRLDAVADGIAELKAAHGCGLRREVTIDEHGQQRRLEVRDRRGGPHECVSHAALRLWPGVEPGAAGARRHFGCSPGLGHVSYRRRAFVRLTYVDREGGEVGEVESFQLIVAEHEDDIRLGAVDPLLEDSEGVLNALVLHLIGRKIVRGDIFAPRPVGPNFVAILRRHVPEGCVRR
jgi:hypothetical protein